MANESYTYDVVIGDIVAFSDYSDEKMARQFARGARFVLDNSNQEYVEVKIVTNEHGWNVDDGFYSRELSRKTVLA